MASDMAHSEALRQVSELTEKVAQLKKENMRLKVTLDDYGIESEDIEEVPDAEVIAMQQLELLRIMSDNGVPFEKEETDKFKILTETLIKIRGGTIKRQKKSAKGKDVDEKELMRQLQVLQGGK